ncbi:MAG: carboxypeptidase-like regulatory domain-containing protein [Planctomycetaceae bacterium]|nr:carboxypeptidase-like regulatory domain-containing protein [Planctomycetaceae bacterium]
MKKIFLLILVLCVAGCTNNTGPKVTAVSGTLTQNGKPLTDVRIEFNKIDTGSLSFAETDEQGRFTLIHTHGKMGAEPGKYRVSVFQKSQPVPIPPGQPVPSELPMTPEKPITMSDRSPIEIEVTETGPNQFDIDLK